MFLNELLNCWSIDLSFDRIINRHISAVFWRTILSMIDQSHLVPRRYRHPLTINPHIHRSLFSHVFLVNWFFIGLVHQLKEAKQLIEQNQSSIQSESVGDHSLYVFDWCIMTSDQLFELLLTYFCDFSCFVSGVVEYQRPWFRSYDIRINDRIDTFSLKVERVSSSTSSTYASILS